MKAKEVASSMRFWRCEFGRGGIRSIVLLKVPPHRNRLHGVAGPSPFGRIQSAEQIPLTSLSYLISYYLLADGYGGPCAQKKRGRDTRKEPRQKKGRPPRRGGGKGASATPVLTALLVRA